MNAVELQQVSKKYGSRAALDGVSLSLPAGAALGLLGPNGAGKTTALRLLLGFAKPSSGSVLLFGSDPWRPASRAGVGYLPERLKLPARMTARRFLTLQAKLIGLDASAAVQSIEAVVRQTGIADRLDEHLGGLSKGLAQRVGFASAFLGQPRLLLLDEPTSGLDPIGIREARGWIEGARAAGATILVSAHGLSEVERLCDRVAILDRGRIVLEGATDEVVRPGEGLEDAFVRAIEANR